MVVIERPNAIGTLMTVRKMITPKMSHSTPLQLLSHPHCRRQDDLGAQD
jgi:hypothetical protein